MILPSPQNDRVDLRSKKMHGYTLLELLFYISLFSILALLVINAMITMTKAFRETTIQEELAHSSSILERVSREIRKAIDIDTISANDLKLITTDDVGASKTVEFLFSGSNLQFLENSVLTGNLNSPNITVTNLAFTQINTLEGKAVKITLSVRSNNDRLGRITDFYDTVVFRGAY